MLIGIRARAERSEGKTFFVFAQNGSANPR